jgi:MFS superfamily sulfate permease-like transporter
VGGILIVAIGIPISMGMAEVAGLPPVIGLYSCLLAPVAFAVLGSSRQLVVALDASTAALLAAAVTPLAVGDPARHAALASVVAIMVGAVLILGGLLRVGGISALLSHPVLLGYQAGLAVVVIATQIPKMIGITVPDGSTVGALSAVAQNLGDADVPTAILGVGCLTAIAVSAWRWPSMPAALIAITAATLAVAFTDAFSSVAVVGQLPSGMPSLGLPAASLADLRALVPAVFAIALIASADTIVSSRAFAARNGYDVDASTDLRGLGAANAASGLSGGITISASAARTAVVEMVGVRSQMAGIAAAMLMAVTLLFFTGLLASLPLAALGAVVVGAVARLVDVPAFRQLWRIDRLEWVTAVVTALAAVWLGLLQGIAIGICLSVGVAILRRRGATVRSLVRADVARERRDGVVIARPLEPVTYVNAARVVDNLRSAATDGTTAFVMDASHIDALDATGALALSAFATGLEAADVEVIITGLDATLADVLARAGFWSGLATIDRADDVVGALALAGTPATGPDPGSRHHSSDRR